MGDPEVLSDQIYTVYLQQVLDLPRGLLPVGRAQKEAPRRRRVEPSSGPISSPYPCQWLELLSTFSGLITLTFTEHDHMLGGEEPL